jgi:hypothetical protein
MAKATYFTDVMMINVQMISDNTPNTTSLVGRAGSHAQDGLECIERAGADIAKDNSKRGKAQAGEAGASDRWRGTWMWIVAGL